METPPMGIKRPEKLDEQLAIQDDIRAMRRAITFGRRDSSLLARCAAIAEHRGLSSEEAMVLIAYQALCMLQHLYEHNLKLSMLDIRKPIIYPE